MSSGSPSSLLKLQSRFTVVSFSTKPVSSLNFFIIGIIHIHLLPEQFPQYSKEILVFSLGGCTEKTRLERIERDFMSISSLCKSAFCATILAMLFSRSYFNSSVVSLTKVKNSFSSLFLSSIRAGWGWYILLAPSLGLLRWTNPWTMDYSWTTLTGPP